MPGELENSKAVAAQPAENGVEPAQQSKDVIEGNFTVADWREQAPLSGAFNELMSTGSQNSRTTYLLAATASKIYESENHALRQELEKVKGSLDLFRKDYFDEREKCSVLREQLRHADLKDVMLILGSLAVGGAFSVYLTGAAGQQGFAHILMALGALLIVLAYVLPKLRKMK
jgi:hypothetical protein